MKIHDATDAITIAHAFAKEQAEIPTFKVASSESFFRVVLEVGVLGRTQKELLVDTDGKVRYYGDVRDLIEYPEDRLKNPDIIKGLIKIAHDMADEFEKRLRNYLAANK
jgi:hypothetical protein